MYKTDWKYIKNFEEEKLKNWKIDDYIPDMKNNKIKTCYKYLQFFYLFNKIANRFILNELQELLN